jgi:hypothetical protein
MGEGGGFPQVRAVVSLVSPELLVALPSTKGAPESELTHWVVGWMQIRTSKRLATLPSPILELQHAPLPLLVLSARSVPRVPHNSVV